MDVFVLPLGIDGSPKPQAKGDFLHLPIPTDPYVLRFVIYSSSEICNQGSLWCNVPQKGDRFDRDTFREYPIDSTFNRDTFIDIKVSQPGTFSFYTTYLPISNSYFSDGLDTSPYQSQQGPGGFKDSEQLFKDTYMAKHIKSNVTASRKYYFTVSCGFEVNGKPLPLNSLAVESVVSKWMGEFSTWSKKLGEIKAKGYNMIHFTPLQPRGASDSPYSIFDQLKWDHTCFPNGEDDAKTMVETLEKEHHLLSMTDIVFNHTAHDSEWLKEHPEAGYSVNNSPHLQPALELEHKLTEYSSKLQELGLPTIIQTQDDIDKVMDGMEQHVFEEMRLWEFYVVNVEKIMEHVKAIVNDKERFDRILPTRVPDQLRENLEGLAEYVIDEAGSNFDDFGRERFLRNIDTEYFVSLLKTLESDPNTIAEKGLRILNEINEPLYQQYDEDKSAIVDNVKGRLGFTRLEENGPKLGKITAKCPLQESYFTEVDTAQGTVSLATNGFIWNGDPMIDFASDQSRAYLRRDVIPWGDCVKLRYGSKPADSPYLWDRMTKYTQMLATYFHGLRIDNCHSTPIHVGEYFLDKARLVRPNLYVAAELFTGSEAKDKIFVERLGITSLIREAMQAWSPAELSRLVHKHGGRPIGSFSKQPVWKRMLAGEKEENIHIFRSLPIHALFMDCTHDNATPSEKRTMEDALPTAALVSMCACAVGSTMGFDECYPRSLNIVNETRPYTFGGGFGSVKKKLLDIHSQMGVDNAEEMYIHHEGQYITVHRVDPKQGLGWFLIARTKFQEDGPQELNNIKLKGTQASTELAVSLEQDGEWRDGDKLTGVPTKVVDIDGPQIAYDEETQDLVIKVGEIPQGSIVLLRTWQTSIEFGLDKFVRHGAADATAKCDQLDLNVLLYRCEAEERDSSEDREGCYDIPGYGPLTYAGFQGWISPLEQVVSQNNMGHPICENLRAGPWALEYLVNRLYKYLSEYPNIEPVVEWLEKRVDRLKQIPHHLIPRYFALVVFNVYGACARRALSLMPGHVAHGTRVLQKLALTSVQMVGKVKSTGISPFMDVGSMAAGLPHFSVEYMRCWGRDVFLSFRGLLLSTGRFEDARNHLLAFAATLKHGLIPNLLDCGRNPRYNARDATWFFVHQLQIYCASAPEGLKFLDAKVKRRFPLDDTYCEVDDPLAFSYESTLREIVYEILARHAAGIEFREANAGENLDSQMSDEGFNQSIWVDWKNGFIFGGNQSNCGTWMDKMGESTKAGNKGVPGTPRDGAAIEITGLLKAALRWVNKLHSDGQFDYDSVVNQHGEKVRLKDWEYKVQRSFEKCYYIPPDPRKDVLFEIDSSIVNRRAIYKDLFRSGKPYEDYQLRPNFAIAMCVAPELFNVDRAWGAIGVADALLRGPVGMKTLDPGDLNYNPYYFNNDDSNNFATAKGRNYHQGPEWVWCQGYFLRAFLLFDLMRKKKYQSTDITSTFQQLYKRLEGGLDWIYSSDWAGLPELTNKDGELCPDSSPTQAWSSGQMVELFEDARQYLERTGT